MTTFEKVDAGYHVHLPRPVLYGLLAAATTGAVTLAGVASGLLHRAGVEAPYSHLIGFTLFALLLHPVVAARAAMRGIAPPHFGKWIAVWLVALSVGHLLIWPLVDALLFR